MLIKDAIKANIPRNKAKKLLTCLIKISYNKFQFFQILQIRLALKLL